MSKEISKAEVGTPLQKVLVNNFNAQKQIIGVIECYYKAWAKKMAEELEKALEGEKRNMPEFEEGWDRAEYEHDWQTELAHNTALLKAQQIIRERLNN